MSGPVFTIVTPTFNAADSLRNVIQSVQDQTFAQVEHLVIDGGSSDQTLAILEQYPHLRWSSEPDQGIYDALNKGIERAQGDWILFLGADDELYATDVLESAAQRVSSDLRVLYGDVVSDVFGGRYGGAWDAERILKTNICHQAIFFHRTVFERTGLFDLQYPWLADWDHNMRWMLDPELPSMHVDLVVARYGADGVSSLQQDVAFYRDRRFNYLRYGLQTLPTGRACWLVIREVLKSLRSGNFGRIGDCFRLGRAYLSPRRGSSA